MAARSLFLNLPVKDLAKSKEFFAKLGFTYNAQFTDERAACMFVSDLGYVMLLQESFFKTFTRRDVADPRAATGAIVALSCESREEVDRLARIALEGGGTPAMPPVDHGFMYSVSFYDVDGHHWEVLWMDPAHVKPA